MFPYIDNQTIDTVRGLDVQFSPSAPTDDEGRALLRALGFPFRRTEAQG
jgi:large subunit ribosomal protein L5